MRVQIYNWNNILTEVAEELKKRGHEVDVQYQFPRASGWKKFDVFVFWNGTELGGWKDHAEMLMKAGKKVVLVQHGRWGTSRIFPPFREMPVCDYICVWGEGDKRRMSQAGIPVEKIKVTGTPVLRHLKPREQHMGINVIYSPEHWDQEVVENVIVASKLRNLKGVNITTKILAGEHDESLYDKPVASKRLSPDNLEVCADVLKTADLVVAISESTFELMAETLDIPVVIADIWIPKASSGDIRYKDYQREYSNACTRVKDINKLNETIMSELRHPERLKNERQTAAIEDGGMNLVDPVDNIIQVILN